MIFPFSETAVSKESYEFLATVLTLSTNLWGVSLATGERLRWDKLVSGGWGIITEANN